MQRVTPGPAAMNASLPADRPVMDDFLCVGTLGRGQFGVAFLMQPKMPGSTDPVVVKRIDLSAMSESERSDASREIEVLKRLREHPHIIEYLDDWTITEPVPTLYIKMAYANGGTLQHYIADARERAELLSEALIAEWLVELLSAMEFIHTARVLHRDLKPANIFLHRLDALPFPILKLGDFGIARVLSNTHSMASTVCGTPFYLSPELIAGEPYHSPSDVWALGVVLYEAACLVRPFDGNNIGSVALAVMRKEPPPFPRPARFSPELERIVESMLRKSAAERATLAQLLSLEYVAAAREQQAARVRAGCELGCAHSFDRAYGGALGATVSASSPGSTRSAGMSELSTGRTLLGDGLATAGWAGAAGAAGAAGLSLIHI